MSIVSAAKRVVSRVFSGGQNRAGSHDCATISQQYKTARRVAVEYTLRGFRKLSEEGGVDETAARVALGIAAVELNRARIIEKTIRNIGCRACGDVINPVDQKSQPNTTALGNLAARSWAEAYST